MEQNLTRSPSDYEELFRNLGHPRDVADLLEVPNQTLNYWIYAKNEAKPESTEGILRRRSDER